MGILTTTSNISKSKSKIPDYARDYRNEYLFIRGIDKTCGEFLKKFDEEEIFKIPQADRLIRHINKLFKAEELGYLNDISEIKFLEKDINNIDSLLLQLDDYRDLYCDPDSYEFDEEKYNNNIENDYPGFKELFECVSPLIDKLQIDMDITNRINFDSDSDSDDGVDSDDIAAILNGCEDSESDSDSN